VIAIHDKINFTNFINFNGLHPCTLSIERRGLDVCPALLIFRAARQEGTREIRVASHAAYDGIQWNLLHATLGTEAQLELFRHVIVGQQAIGFPCEARQNFLHSRALPCGLKVLDRHAVSQWIGRHCCLSGVSRAIVCQFFSSSQWGRYARDW
jgi:hypothetical protein